MIHSIRLINFERHSDSLIKLSGGINIIHGTTDGGKSAIMRALQLVIKNVPRGNDYIKRGETDCQVEVVVYTEDGTRVKVTRVRTKSKNEYRIKVPKQEEQIFKAMGDSVPEEVTKIFNFGAYNIQTQFGKFFLLQDTAGSVSREFNALVGLGSIDRHYSAEKSAALLLTTEKKVFEEKLEEATKHLDDDCWDQDNLDELTEIANTIEALEKSKKAKREGIEGLTALKRKLVAQTMKRDSSTYKTGTIEAIEELKQLYIEKNTMQGALSNLSDAVDTLKEECKLAAMEVIETALGLIDNLRVKITKRSNLYNSTAEVQSAKKSIEVQEMSVSLAEDELDQLQKELGVCPLCGGKHEDCSTK